jgi:hypothetical protein
VTTKNVVFRDVGLCRFRVNRLSEERIASIIRAKKSAIAEPASAGGCRLSHQSEMTSYIGTERKGAKATWEINSEDKGRVCGEGQTSR